MIRRAMERPIEPLRGALATLQTRWGSAVIRLGDGQPAGLGAEHMDTAIHGALALAALPEHSHPEAPPAGPDPGRGLLSTGFPDLDAILGPAGLPQEASVVVRGAPSSGKTTLALRCAAEAQAAGDIVAWLDLGQAFDPVEAVGRGVDLRWLLVVRPADVTEGLALAGALLSGRCVGLLVVDLPARCPARADEQLRRLVAHARRTGARLVVLEPASAAAAVHGALAQVSGLRLELERRAWLRLGRDVVGQRTTVAVAKNRYGPPGRSVDLEIHYLPEGERGVTIREPIREEPPAPALLESPKLPALVALPAGAVSSDHPPAERTAGGARASRWIPSPDRERPGPRLVVV
jgi:RecA/RadA recombinase